MPDFDESMNQLLAAVRDAAPGRRERWLRTVRQHDLQCWPEGANADAENAMKAAMRVAVHEVLDQLCFQLEAALTRSDNEPTRVFVLALTALAMTDGLRVKFRDGQSTTGISYPGDETLVIEVLPGSKLGIELVTSSEEVIASEEVTINPTELLADPFAAARDFIDRLRDHPSIISSSAETPRADSRPS